MDQRTQQDIDRTVEKVLSEMMVREPPLDLDEVFAHLAIDHGYYDLADPTLLRDVWHRIKIGPSQLVHLLKKVDLKGLWLPDRNRILVDAAIPNLKKRWANAHEVGHKIIPTHSAFFLGDTPETLDPEYQCMLEEEANYAASGLLFLNRVFTADAHSLPVCVGSVKALSNRYKNSFASTLRRYIHRGPDLPLIGVISKAKWDSPSDSAESRCRHLMRSPLFQAQFGVVPRGMLIDFIDTYAECRRGGPVGEGESTISDRLGNPIRFRSETFYNQYDLLTLLRPT
jgi:hypothetical protein